MTDPAPRSHGRVTVRPTLKPRDLMEPPEVAGAAPLPFTLAITRQESSFDPLVRSHADARGMMQLLPATAQGVARRMGRSFSSEQLWDPEVNMTLGSYHLGELMNNFGGSPLLAAVGYNAGPARPPQWTARCGDPRQAQVDPIDFIECAPFTETRNYVVRVTGKQAEDWIGAKNDPEMLLMPAKAPCAEVIEAVQAQAKTVRAAKLISELASTASQMRDKPAPQPAPEVLSENTDRGWRGRVTAMVLEVLRRLEQKEAAAKAAAKTAAKSVGAAALKTAQRDKIDERALAKAARRAEVKTFVASGNRNAPKSTDREVDRTAMLIPGRDDSIDAANRDFNGLGKIDMAKSEPAGPEITKIELVGLADGNADAAKPDTGKRAAQRHSANVVKFIYADTLRPY